MPSSANSSCPTRRRARQIRPTSLSATSCSQPMLPQPISPTGIGPRSNAHEGVAMTTHDVISGGYRYLEAFFQYSGGVRALDGYHMERVRLRHPLPIAEGFERIEKYLT